MNSVSDSCEAGYNHSMSPLTAKQAKFVNEYLVDGNGTRAAIAAGYGRPGAHVTASRLLRDPKVQKALQARQSVDATRLSLSRDRVVAGLLRAVEEARFQANPAAMIAGWREIGRMLGFYSPEVRRVEITSPASQAERARFEAMSDAELLAVINAGVETAAA